ncbi:MAG: signal recognition particle-docking protein FtsY, partial [Ignavibacteria bacterium RBG_13_36_8]
MKNINNINFNSLKAGLDKTRSKLVKRISETFSSRAYCDEELLEKIEEILITSDIGFNLTKNIIAKTRLALCKEKDRNEKIFMNLLKKELTEILICHCNDNTFEKIAKYRPYIILIVGVNGVGKTTTIGKLANIYKQSSLEVLICSADTFRAAANEQISIWAQRADVEIIYNKSGTDPSSVVYDTLNVAKRKNIDIVLIDTAGRLHTNSNLMFELKKIQTVMNRVLDYAPNEVFLVLDATNGQNSIQQLIQFNKFIPVTGLIITKLDGTAKGGVIFQICEENNIPIKYIGVGENIEDLQNFNSELFS